MNIIGRIIRKIRRDTRKAIQLRKLRSLGMKYVEPNFIYRTNLPKDGVVVDAGCSYEADFSIYMIENYGLQAFGVDPTRKHRPALEILEEKYHGKFKYLPFAVTAEDGFITFYESRDNESGSILDDHSNVRNDRTDSYEVETVSLATLAGRSGRQEIAILKLDLEGAEYELLDKSTKDDFLPFEQVFVEFHHHAIEKYSISDTNRLVGKISGFGYKCFSLDGHNFLFYKASS